MLISIKTKIQEYGGTFFQLWLYTSAREILYTMGIEYIFRGFVYSRTTPRDRSEIFIIAISEEDFDLIKIALGEVDMFTSEMSYINIMHAGMRAEFFLPRDSHMDWERELSNPPCFLPIHLSKYNATPFTES